MLGHAKETLTVVETGNLTTPQIWRFFKFEKEARESQSQLSVYKGGGHDADQPPSYNRADPSKVQDFFDIRAIEGEQQEEGGAYVPGGDCPW
jgi:hypothetical protein